MREGFYITILLLIYMKKNVISGLVGIVLSCFALEGCDSVGTNNHSSVTQNKISQTQSLVSVEEKSINERDERYKRIISGNLTSQENFILNQIRNSGRVVGVEIDDFKSASNYINNLYGIDLFDSNHRNYYDVGEDIILRKEFIGDEQYVFHLALAACDILYNGQDFDRNGIMNSQLELNRIESELNKFDLSFYGVFPNARDIYNTNSPSMLGRPIVR